jgi:xylan 1,4-beta-xylosidase
MDCLTFQYDVKNQTDNLDHYWETCVGSCHGYTALREDYRRQLKEAHENLGFRYLRFHGILDDDMCVVQEEHGNILYNFVNIDNIFDYLLDIGMKPFMEIGFMPKVFASGTSTLFHYNANNTMPRDFSEWDRFITTMINHFIDRYGLEEVRTWFFEVWNEPNLKFFFNGTQKDYFQLFEHTARAIKQADSLLRVGGPATALNAWIPDMLQFCKTNHVPLDFISTHHYPTDDPLWKSGMNLEEFFARVEEKSKDGDRDAYKNAQKYHRGILTEMIRKACTEAENYPVYYTEWNTSAINGDSIHDYPYSAAFVIKTVLDNIGYVQGYSFWTFTDIFEESPQKIGEFHGGFGLQTIHGVKKPTYRAFEILHNLGNVMYPRAEEQDTVGTFLAKGRDGGYCLIAYNQQVPDAPSEDERQVRIKIKNLKIHDASIFRIDESHCNVRKTWEEMGAPIYPDRYRLQILQEASELKAEHVDFETNENEVSFCFLLPKDSVALIKMA